METKGRLIFFTRNFTLVIDVLFYQAFLVRFNTNWLYLPR